MTCLTPTSTDGNEEPERTKPSGALSSRQITALIQEKKWWPFDRVDGKILVRMHKKMIDQQPEEMEQAPL